MQGRLCVSVQEDLLSSPLPLCLPCSITEAYSTVKLKDIDQTKDETGKSIGGKGRDRGVMYTRALHSLSFSPRRQRKGHGQ